MSLISHRSDLLPQIQNIKNDTDLEGQVINFAKDLGYRIVKGVNADGEPLWMILEKDPFKADNWISIATFGSLDETRKDLLSLKQKEDKDVDERAGYVARGY